MRNTRGTTNENNLVDVTPVDLRITEYLLDGFEHAAEEVLAELFKTRMGDGGEEVDTLVERIGFDGGQGCG